MDIGILLWNTCNAKCAHCAVSSGPDQKRSMTNLDIKKIIDASFLDGSAPSIGLSGGEAFFFFDDLMELVKYATSKGAKIAINTNCFWAADESEARRIVGILKDAKVTKLVASTDVFHMKYISDDFVIRAVEACMELHLEIEIQYVSNRRTERMHSFLARHADRLVNITCREIPCHPVGRAKNMSDQALIIGPSLPRGKCPNAVLSVSADGRYIPCCNTAGHLPALEIGRVGENQLTVFNRFKNSPIMGFLWAEGPAGFMEAAKDIGYRENSLGYVDQCHLCHDLFRDENVALALREAAEEYRINLLKAEFKSQLLAKAE